MLPSTLFSSCVWGVALEKFQPAAKYVREQCQVLLSSMRVPQLWYCEMLFRKGKWLAAELSRSSLCTYTCLIVHVLLCKISSLITDYRRICVKQLCGSWPIRSLSLAENSSPLLAEESFLRAVGIVASVQTHAPGMSQLTWNSSFSVCLSEIWCWCVVLLPPPMSAFALNKP